MGRLRFGAGPGRTGDGAPRAPTAAGWRKIAGYLTRTSRESAADLFLCLYSPPHRPTRTEKRRNRRNTAAMITRGAGRDAAVTPAGEGGRERGAGWRETGRTAAQSGETKEGGSHRRFRPFIPPFGGRKPIRGRRRRHRARGTRALLQMLRIRNSGKKMEMVLLMH